MTVRKRPDAAREELRRQESRTRRGAPGKRFVGDAAGQSGAAKRAERRKVERLRWEEAAAQRAAEPLSAVLAELVENAYLLARTLAKAPVRIARAFLRPAEA